MRFLITGGAGFIGCNYADRRLSAGDDVVVYDNLSRPRTDLNLEWLRSRHDAGLTFVQGDIRDYRSLVERARGMDAVVHLAGQVAVTTSVANPREDFETNALGTFNVLEAARLGSPEAVLLFASTNKVYGGLEDVSAIEESTRYVLPHLPSGVPETYPLDFHSPYGCSKGAADQYVRDYSRVYGMKTVVLRQSCIYGVRQFGVEDQGWVAHFCISAALGRPITIYGDGKQVRDVLWVEDLLDAYDLSILRSDAAAGQIFNLGGGPANTMSIWAEFGPILSSVCTIQLDVQYRDARIGDQKVYISNIDKAREGLGWSPRVSVREGVDMLWEWVSKNRSVF
jgi:CDP-paratose 2-epimerase